MFHKSQRIRNLYSVNDLKPFKLSRSKIENFMNCRRCFYLDRKCGVGQPPGFPFNLNSAVDALLKKEFDVYRASGKPHPLMVEHQIDGVPFDHEKIDQWRTNLTGVRFHHEATGFMVFGAVDDIWINSNGELHVVDYKATSKGTQVSLDADWQMGYKRQMEIYQWLLRQNGFNVSPKGYFVYCNGRRGAELFGGKLDFDISILEYVGDDIWIEPTLCDIKSCLEGNKIPEISDTCPYCQYNLAVNCCVKDGSHNPLKKG